MGKIYNIYCDESCHIDNKTIIDDNRFMVLGGVSCLDYDKQEVFDRIKEIKSTHDMSPSSEMKWTKIAVGKLQAYKDLINYFFDADLIFRAVVIDKTKLNVAAFNHTHDQFYYKMYWLMLEWFLEPTSNYNIYLDLKDTQGVAKVNKLREVLCNSSQDFNRDIIARMQEVRSHQVSVLQITDILIGAISYATRYPAGGRSNAKNEIVNLIRKRSNLKLTTSTLPGAKQFNILHWEGMRR